MMAIDAIVARGTLRRGFSVSSASGTAASHPVSPCTVNTIASENPLEVAMSPGLKPYVNDWNVKPPGPGSKRPHRPSASTIRNSIAPTTTIVSIESAMPEVADQRDDRKADDDEHPPVEPRPAVVRLELALEDQAQKRQRRAGDDG